MRRTMATALIVMAALFSSAPVVSGTPSGAGGGNAERQCIKNVLADFHEELRALNVQLKTGDISKEEFQFVKANLRAEAAAGVATCKFA